MKYISLSVFILSFCLGIIYIYLSKPELKTVKISPTPDNCEHTMYKDKANICYQYKAHEVACSEKSSFFSIQS